jgi:hypothetical protein
MRYDCDACGVDGGALALHMAFIIIAQPIQAPAVTKPAAAADSSKANESIMADGSMKKENTNKAASLNSAHEPLAQMWMSCVVIMLALWALA